MAKKSIKTKTKSTAKSKEKLEQTVDLLVEEIERTGNLDKISKEAQEKNTIFDDTTDMEDYIIPKKVQKAIVEDKKSDNDDYKNEDKKKETIQDLFKEEKKENTKKLEIEKSEKIPVKRKRTGDTNLYDFKFDNERLAEVDSLDTSFLEGRIKNKKKLVETEVKTKKIKRKKDENIDNSSRRKTPVILILFLMIIAGLSGFLGCYFFVTKTEIVVKEKKIIKEKKVIDDNYVFLGDSITDFYDLDEYFEDMPVVQSGINGNTTEDILDDMKSRVYKYNPSKIFILIGTNDYVKLDGNESIEKNIKKIIEEIQKNRPLAEIYIQSIYPINSSDDDKINKEMVGNRKNSEIIEANEIIKKIAKEKNVTYIDMFSKLYDTEKEELKLEYTKEGLHISDKGYEVITEELKKYM